MNRFFGNKEPRAYPSRPNMSSPQHSPYSASTSCVHEPEDEADDDHDEIEIPIHYSDDDESLRIDDSGTTCTTRTPVSRKQLDGSENSDVTSTPSTTSSEYNASLYISREAPQHQVVISHQRTRVTSDMPPLLNIGPSPGFQKCVRRLNWLVCMGLWVVLLLCIVFSILVRIGK